MLRQVTGNNTEEWRFLNFRSGKKKKEEVIKKKIYIGVGVNDCVMQEGRLLREVTGNNTRGVALREILVTKRIKEVSEK